MNWKLHIIPSVTAILLSAFILSELYLYEKYTEINKTVVGDTSKGWHACHSKQWRDKLQQEFSKHIPDIDLPNPTELSTLSSWEEGRKNPKTCREKDKKNVG